MEFGKEYIKTFETEAEYLAFKATSGYNKPNVSYVDDDIVVHYDPYVDPYAGHDYVEIGGIKWATMNVGANSVTDTGLYFQWADTQGYTASEVGSGDGKKYFGFEDYKWTNDDGITFTKYNSTDGKTVLDSEDDAVTAAWGGKWRMPTDEDFAALSAAVTTTWVTDYQGSGVNGILMTDKIDSSKVLFFPAGGRCEEDNVTNISTSSHYWSSTTSLSSWINRAKYFSATSVGVSWTYEGARCYGRNVRGVVDE